MLLTLARAQSYAAFCSPKDVMSGCFGSDRSFNKRSACGHGFDPQAGAMWEQRYKQYLLQVTNT